MHAADVSNRAGITVSGVEKALSGKPVLKGISLDIREGEFVAVLGPSGCGKTTLLRLLAGFEKLDRGSIAIGGRVVSSAEVHLPPERRSVGIVFQSFALWPHMSVAENVAYSLKIAGVGRAEREARTAEALAKVNLEGLGGRRPADLSGGQRQRVALARCLVARPELVLLDEPLANLDVHLRAAMEEEFGRFHRAAGATTVYVTHDQAEAMALADRVAVMDGGRIVQFDTPRALYDRPADEFAARFVGDGRVFDVENVRPDGEGCAVADFFGLPVRFRSGAASSGRRRARVCLRSYGLRFAQGGEPGVAGRVLRSVYRGGFRQVEVVLSPGAGEGRVVLFAAPDFALSEGSRVSVAVDDGWMLPEPAAAENVEPRHERVLAETAGANQ